MIYIQNSAASNNQFMSIKKSHFTQQQKQEFGQISLSHSQANNSANKKVVDYFIKALEESQDVQKIQWEIQVTNCQSKENQSNQQTVLNCLIFLLAKYQRIRIKFNVSVRSKKTKKSQNILKLYLSESQQLNIDQIFCGKIQNLTRKQAKNLIKMIRFIRIVWSSESTVHMSKNKVQQLLNLKQLCYNFNLNLYQYLDKIYQGMLIFGSHSIIPFPQENIQREYIQSMLEDQKIMLDKLFMTIMSKHNYTISLPNRQIDLINICQKIQQSQIKSIVKQQIHETQSKFLNQHPFKILRQMQFECRSLSDFQKIQQILPFFPNLSILQLNNSNQQPLILPSIKSIIHILIANNNLIKQVSFHHISVSNIQEDILQQLYTQCPFLAYFSVNYQFRYLLQQTYAFQSPEQRQIKEKQRKCHLILKAMSLRNITISHRLKMGTLLLQQGYDFNSTIEIVDCIEQICF